MNRDRSTIDYLMAYHHWEAVHTHGETARGLCPLHVERVPSFIVNIEDHSWHCFHGSGEGGSNLLSLIMALEGLSWDEALSFYRERTGDTALPPSQQQMQEKSTLLRYATEEERLMLTAAMQWWNDLLCQSYYGKRGRMYLEQRGIPRTFFSSQVQFGYIPPLTSQGPDGRYRTATQMALFHGYMEKLRQSLGGDCSPHWQEVGLSLGLLRRKEDTGEIVEGLYDRVVQCCLNSQGECVFFHARKVESRPPRDESEAEEWKKWAHRFPTNLAKVPFSIPVPHPQWNVLAHTESYFSASLLAAYGIPAKGWGGCSPVSEFLLQDTTPKTLHLLAQDNDEPHYTKEGQVYYPGDAIAQRFMAALQQENRPFMRFITPRAYNSPDAWATVQGIEPILAYVQQLVDEHSHSHLSKREEKGLYPL